MTEVAPWRLLRRALSVPRISGTWANCGSGLPERLVELNLPRRVGQMVVAANDVGDRHVDVVDDDAKIVGRRAVGAGDDQIVELAVVEDDIAFDQVFDYGGRLRAASGSEWCTACQSVGRQ